MSEATPSPAGWPTSFGVEFSQEVEESAEGPIRVRIAPMKYAPDSRAYNTIRNLRWFVDLVSREQAEEFFEALRLFFAWLAQEGGPTRLVQTLRGLVREKGR